MRWFIIIKIMGIWNLRRSKKVRRLCYWLLRDGLFRLAYMLIWIIIVTLISIIIWLNLLLYNDNGLTVHFKIRDFILLGRHSWSFCWMHSIFCTVIKFNVWIHLFLPFITVCTIFILKCHFLRLNYILSFLNFLLFNIFLFNQIIIVFCNFHFFSCVNCIFLILVTILNNRITA